MVEFRGQLRNITSFTAKGKAEAVVPVTERTFHRQHPANLPPACGKPLKAFPCPWADRALLQIWPCFLTSSLACPPCHFGFGHSKKHPLKPRCFQSLLVLLCQALEPFTSCGLSPHSHLTWKTLPQVSTWTREETFIGPCEKAVTCSGLLVPLLLPHHPALSPLQ